MITLKQVKQLSMAALMIMAVTGTAFGADTYVTEEKFDRVIGVWNETTQKYEGGLGQDVAKVVKLEAAITEANNQVGVRSEESEFDGTEVKTLWQAAESNAASINQNGAAIGKTLKAIGNDGSDGKAKTGLNLSVSTLEKNSATKAELTTKANAARDAAIASSNEYTDKLAKGAVATNTQDIEANDLRLDQQENRMDSMQKDIDQNSEGIAIMGAFNGIASPYKGEGAIGAGMSTFGGKMGWAVGVGKNFKITESGSYSITIQGKGGMSGKSAAGNVGATLHF